VGLEYDGVQHGWVATDSFPELPGIVIGAEELAALFLARTAMESIRGTTLEAPMREVFAKLLQPLEGEVRLSWSAMEEVFTRKMPEMKARDVKLFGELADAVVHRR